MHKVSPDTPNAQRAKDFPEEAPAEETPVN